MNEEAVLWKGGSSQWLNAGSFAVALLVSAAIIVGGVWFPVAYVALVLPLGWAVWQFLVIRTRVFELTSERLRITSGVLNQTVDEVELYRVKDSILVRPWWMRPLGLSNIVLETSDRSLPRLEITGLPGGDGFREMLRKQVELQRDRKRVREMDFDESAPDDAPVAG